MDPAKFPAWLRILVVLIGLALIIYEAVGRSEDPRYWLLILYAGMIGIPALFGLDTRTKGPAPGPPVPPSPTQLPAEQEDP